LAHLQQPSQVAMQKAVETPAAARLHRKRRLFRTVAASLVALCFGGLVLAYLAGWLYRAPESSHPDAKSTVVKNGGNEEEVQHVAKKQPVAKEVLDDLHRLVSVQQENLQNVELNFKAESMTRLEVCAAEVLLIEARIKLAAAEQKPVIDLLEDLVRNREEELSVIETRFEAGAARVTEVDRKSTRLNSSH